MYCASRAQGYLLISPIGIIDASERSLMEPVSVVYHEGVSGYDFGPGHPFRSDRFKKFMDRLKVHGLLDDPRVSVAEPESADDELLKLIHPEAYIREVERRGGNHIPLTRDTPLNPSIVEAARLVVGASALAGELVVTGAAEVGEGVGGGLHHAGRGYGGGFCVFNDVAVCAQNLIERHGLERVLILDSDVHAGNGTMDVFYDDPRVLFVSVHQNPLTIYPGTGFIEQIGEGEGVGFTVNVPLPPGAGDKCMDLFLEEVFRPISEEFKPQVIIRNGGTDPHFLDGLGRLNLTFQGLWGIGKAVAEASEEAGCGVVDLCCSGYNPATVADGWLSLLTGVMGERNPSVEPAPPPGRSEEAFMETERVIRDIKRLLGEYWDIS
jgi:acetoin utilization protein AcuC